MIKVKKAYICSPLSAPTQEEIRCNMHQARQHMKAVADKYGCRTFAPHAYLPELLDDHCPEERALGLSFGNELLKICQILIICGNRISVGMYGEIKAALALGLRIYSCVPEKGYQLTLLTDGRRTDEMQI
ncbi:hypothetical protein K040078D81_61590 [Blautia hominis]|uniref:DUF7768 domain-containing protein n=2 Tax=Lachnospiraceae TaxID=186803 RepID=A0ABQ0BKR0_9FIRM